MRRRLSWLAVASLLASCVDGSSPVGVGTVRTVQLAAAPVFTVAPSLAEAAELTHARVSARDADSGNLLGMVEEDIDPSASQWTLALELTLTEGQPLHVRLEVELGNATVVAWSGRSGSFAVTAGTQPQEVREIPLYRGPLDNLDVTKVTADTPSDLLAGESTQLQVQLEGGGAGARAYFESLDAAVATVDASGLVQALQEGTARIVALAGPAADTVSVTVTEIQLPPGDVLSGSVTPQVSYTAQVIAGTMGDAEGASAIADALGDLDSALSGGKAADAVRAFQAAVDAWSAYGQGTDLRILDGPQLSIIELTLINAADALGIPFE